MKTRFVIEKEPTVVWPVTVEIPAGGQLEKHRFEATFRVLPEAAYAEIEAQVATVLEKIAASKGRMNELVARNAELLPPLVVSWDGPQAEDGTPVPVGDLPALLTGPYGAPLAKGLSRAINQIRLGVPAEDVASAAEGNSAPSPAAG